ncbi:MAG: hypothetical protein HQ485_09120 [Acidobacteria bacterium]|nr:hypothetical protein [Acidobacteriota bacterium]
MAGALLGAACLMAVYPWTPSLTVDMDRPVPSVVSGFYGEERSNRETFAWTQANVTMTLADLDRSSEWTCVIRLRGGRADLSTLPEVTVSVDGIVTRRVEPSNEYADVSVVLPTQPRPGAIIGLTVSNTFVPDADNRPLGVMVDHWTCAPIGASWVRPPARALTAAAAIGGIFGAAVALAGAPALAWGVVLLTILTLQAVALSWDFGAFAPLPTQAAGLALGLAALLVAGTTVTARLLGRPLSTTARWVACITIGVCYLKMLALMHPSKPIVDAVFHVHRLQWILEGRWYFTQTMPSGVSFPYAIGLYVFAAPWTLLTNDFVWLLRLVVVMAEALGGVLVYALITRYWNDRPLAAVAAVLMALVPRTFEIVGNANMTNAFGQSAALIVLTAATLWALEWKRWRPWLGFTLLITGALLCHISTFTLLSAILMSLAAAYWFFGDRTLRGPALSIVTALALAGVLAVAVYYGHFGEAYRSAARIQAAAPLGATPLAAAPLGQKISDAITLTVAGIGWPLFFLASAGGITLFRQRRRDRLTLAILALGVTFSVFAIGVVFAPVEQSFQRYSAEFFSRVTLATYPAMVIAAALGLVTLWRAGAAGRWPAAALGLAALAIGAREWVQWLR